MDLMVRQGVIDNPPKTPFTMGFELAGEVEALGENTSRFAVCQSNRYIYFIKEKQEARHRCGTTLYAEKQLLRLTFSSYEY